MQPTRIPTEMPLTSRRLTPWRRVNGGGIRVPKSRQSKGLGRGRCDDGTMQLTQYGGSAVETDLGTSAADLELARESSAGMDGGEWMGTGGMGNGGMDGCSSG